MTVPDVNAPPVGEHGAPCAVCAAPLASDQRYCLSCGARRAEARLPFREILTTNAAVAAAAPAPTPARAAGASPDDGNRSALTALAAIGCLLLALGVGVLIGGAGDSGNQAATPAPQVISVGGATGSSDAAAAAAGTGAAAGAAAGSSAAKKKASKSAASSSTPTNTPQKSSLKKLEKLSPTQYQKQSTKLPKVVGTGGAPPPKDNKAPAGGGDFQSIG